MATGSRTDPYLGYRFLVEVDSLIVAGFSEVSGLEMSMEPETYQEGGVNAYTHQLPTRMEYENLVLKRGLTDDPSLVEWARAATNDPSSGPAERKTIRVFLQDTDGLIVWGWECREAMPVRWAGPDLDATDGAVAFETVEFAHHGLSTIQGLP